MINTTNIPRINLVTEEGKPVSPRKVVVPILKGDQLGLSPQYIGTGFIVHRNPDVVLTAKHLLDDCYDGKRERFALGICDFSSGGITRSISSWTQFGRADVALAYLEPLPVVGIIDGSIRFKVSPKTPNTSKVFALTYVRSKIQGDGKKFSGEFNLSAVEGKLTKFYREGRDSVMLPHPCWRSRLLIEPSTSGAPVFTSDGTLIGLCSSSLESDHTESNVSSFAHLLCHSLEDGPLGGKKLSELLG